MAEATIARGTDEPAAADLQPTRRQWYSLIILSLSLGIIIIDASIVNVAVKSLTDEFNASVADIQWISATYSLCYAALLITFGRLGDVIGRRLIFILGIVTFVLGSLVVGAAPGIGIILVGRVIQGLGAAMASPATLSILSTTFKGRSRSIAFAVWGATAGAAGALGPLLGGFFVTYISWRWAFLINVPVGLIAIIGAFALIDESKEGGLNRSFDLFGTVLASLGLAALVFGFIEATTYGWLAPKDTPFTVGSFTWATANTLAISPVAFIVAVVFLVAFVIVEEVLARRGSDPLFDLRLLRYRAFRYGLMTVGIVALGEFGILLILSLYFQEVRGLTALNTGLVLLPFAAGAFFTAPVAGVLAQRFGPKYVVTAGMLCESLAIFLISRVTAIDTSYGLLVPIFLLYGLGLGLAIAQLTNIVLSDIPPQYAGTGSGVNNTLRQVGAAIGVAILGAILASQVSTNVQSALQASTVIPAPVQAIIRQSVDKSIPKDVTLAIVDAFVAKFNASVQAGGGPPSGVGMGENPATGTGQAGINPAGPPKPLDGPAIHAATATVLDNATTQGTRDTGLAAALFVLLGAISSLLIPNPRVAGAPAVAPH